MSMSPRDWRDLATVFEAGAKKCVQYSYNTDQQLRAACLHKMRDRCEEIAAERNTQEPE